jgi:phosphoglycerate-specific signal transduction histidine kinase
MDELLEQANDLLVRDDASTAELSEMLGRVQALNAELSSQPLPDPDTAMTLGQRKKLQADREEGLGNLRVVSNVAAALRRKLDEARCSEAIGMADENRRALESTLKAAEKAIEKAAQAKAAAFSELERLGRSKSQAKGHPGVGASPDQVGRLYALGVMPDDLGRVVAHRRYQAR